MQSSIVKVTAVNANVSIHNIGEFSMQSSTISAPFVEDFRSDGCYPIAIIPGQFSQYFKQYTAHELGYLPVGRAIFQVASNKDVSFFFSGEFTAFLCYSDENILSSALYKIMTDFSAQK